MKNNFILVILMVAILAASSFASIYYVDDLDNRVGSGKTSDPFRDLQYAIDHSNSDDTIVMRPGNYAARATPFVEALCGNCQEHRYEVRASTGFVVIDKALTIIGAGSDSTILVTNAGYGLYIENSSPVLLSGVMITGGIRDADGNATDAGIVARESRVIVSNCAVRGNTSRDTTVIVGIGGIFGREGAELFIFDNLIEDNGWDGIALYRGATAYIANNVIRKGRGAGIGITWDAVALIYANHVSEYWKGIGSFGDTRVIARDNEVFDNLGWGIIATGRSWMDAANNAVIRNGNCGMAVWGSECRGRFTNNLVVNNGWRKEWVCPCVGLWFYSDDSLLAPEARLSGFEISYNNVWGNVVGNYQDIPDLTAKSGNISIDPEFSNPADSTDFTIMPFSRLLNAGNPAVAERDGGASDIGPSRK